MKTPLRSTPPRSRREPNDDLLRLDPAVAAAIRQERRDLDAIERGTFRGDIIDKEVDLSNVRPIDEDEEFMRSVYPDWPDMTIMADQTKD